MLLELHISGLGVIDDVSLELSPGLNVLTGETGAGKTMVTVGLALALGRRARSGLVRPAAGKARVEALFDASTLPTAEWAEEGQLVLARTVAEDGRSTARAGGQIAPVGTLAELGRDLVEVHGQHQTQRLLGPAAQLTFLDRFTGREHLGTVAEYREAHGRLRSARARLERLDADVRAREREKDLLAYQVREIEAAELGPGEISRLTAEESRLAHAERIRDSLAEALTALADEGTGVDALRAAAARSAEAAGLDPGAAELAKRLESLAAEGSDVVSDLRMYTEGVELDPLRLEAVRERLAMIHGLTRKYGEAEEGILSFLDQARARLASLEGEDDERERLAGEVDRLASRAASLAASVSAGRTAAAPHLSEALQAELHELGMEGAVVEVRLIPQELGPDGGEGVALLFSGGHGQPPQPLSQVASGGELSRTMLACRTVLADLDEVPTLVFDEVDAGIGGRAGVAVGRRLARLARRRQVVVVTHLPQIACFAERHFRVTKETGATVVTALGGSARVEELSRMLSGLPTDEAATHAEQLLAEAAREGV